VFAEAAAQLELEPFQTIGQSGARGVGIVFDSLGWRRLLTVIPEHRRVEPILEEYRVVDLEEPILYRLEVAGQKLCALSEHLPLGLPSHSRVVEKGWPHFLALARAVDSIHQQAVLVRALRPELVFVTPEDPFVTSIGLRSSTLLELRSEDPCYLDESIPLFSGKGFFAPTTEASLVDTVFRLAAVLWCWRHGKAPFPATIDGLHALSQGVPITSPVDAFDELLIECFSRLGSHRPGILLLLQQLEEYVRKPDILKVRH